MCMSCGCGQPRDDHGNPDNITLQDMEKAAQAADITTERAAENIRAAC